MVRNNNKQAERRGAARTPAGAGTGAGHGRKPPEPPEATSDRRATHLGELFTKMPDKS